MRVKLTDRFCAAVKATSQTDYFDSQTPGLALRVGARAKSWTLHHQRKRLTLGQYPAMSLAGARAAAITIRDTGALAQPSDTLRTIAEAYLAQAKLRSIAQYRRIFNRHILPALGDRQIGEIKRSEVVKMLDALPGDRIHDYVLAILRRLLNWHAIRDENFRSPLVAGMAKGTSPRSRILTDPELRSIWRTANPDLGLVNPGYGAFVRLLLLTATRRNEVKNILRSELSPDGTEWLIPAGRYKTGHDTLIPLSEAAQEIIASLPNAGERVFLNGIVRFGKNAKPKLDAVSGVTGWRLHDLRRTARSLMSRAGVPSDHAERCLGHVIGGVRGVYDRHAYVEEKRAAFEALAKEIGKITGDPAPC